MALLVSCYLSNKASFVLRVFRSVKDHHNLLHYSICLKKACVRQVVLDKWFPLNSPTPVFCVSRRAAEESIRGKSAGDAGGFECHRYTFVIRML